MQEYIERSESSVESSLAGPSSLGAKDVSTSTDAENITPNTGAEIGHVLKLSSSPKVVYELNGNSTRIEPQLRIWVSVPAPGVDVSAPQPTLEEEVGMDPQEADETLISPGVEETVERPKHTPRLLWTLQRSVGKDIDARKDKHLNVISPSIDSDAASFVSSSSSPSITHAHTTTQEVVIPLVHDTEFFAMLSSTLESVSTHLNAVHSDFTQSLQQLSKTIGDTSRPASVAGGFHPHSSITSHAGTIKVKTGDMKVGMFCLSSVNPLILASERSLFLAGDLPALR